MANGKGTASNYIAQDSRSNLLGGTDKSKDKDKLAAVAVDIEEVRQIMHKNIDAVISRGENLEALQVKSDELEHNASVFNNNATKLKRKMCLKNAKNTALVVMAILIILCVVALIIYGATK